MTKANGQVDTPIDTKSTIPMPKPINNNSPPQPVMREKIRDNKIPINKKATNGIMIKFINLE